MNSLHTFRLLPVVQNDGRTNMEGYSVACIGRVSERFVDSTMMQAADPLLRILHC